MAINRSTRISDDDRRQAADELRLAHSQGRLTLTEYDERLDQVGKATTYGDIARLFTDLPATAATPAKTTRVPKWVRVVWTWWAVTLVVNLLVWGLVHTQYDDDVHFWPMWLLIPTIAIAAVSYGAIRSHSAKQAKRNVPAWRR
ncbi:DUF1707 SHOCT-like domain-containing protein [Actinokineospora bangkokensis]|uniref:DUF1707 domain-containing protein n=1 Tax=Actinokineospora bangkokensis TaxID=1193682 RepID=A0A1Q9LS18_9PSEU|nr:DUF1707 domain-containing protein [Actinokineospora bangkokensis]OLR94808.1 hypothetical protein BJP25_09240 [Actinokineospora bangkokensis]